MTNLNENELNNFLKFNVLIDETLWRNDYSSTTNLIDFISKNQIEEYLKESINEFDFLFNDFMDEYKDEIKSFELNVDTQHGLIILSVEPQDNITRIDIENLLLNQEFNGEQYDGSKFINNINDYKIDSDDYDTDHQYKYVFNEVDIKYVINDIL